MHRLGRLTRGSITGLGVLAVLVAAAPDPMALRAGLASADRWAERDGLDLVVAQLVGAVAWLAALWLAIGIALVAGARLPGTAGRMSAALARGALPAGVRGTAAMALGVSLATSTVPALGGAPATARQHTAVAASPSVDRQLLTSPRNDVIVPPSVDWPPATQLPGGAAMPSTAAEGRSIMAEATSVDWLLATPSPGEVAMETAAGDRRSTVDVPPSVDWPLTGLAGAGADDGDGTGRVDRPRGAGATPGAVPADHGSTSGPATVPAAGTRPSIVDWPAAGPTDPSTARPLAAGPRRMLVVVRPGDTLWSLASRRLGPGAPAPAIAAEWRRWHAANQDLIGPDPRRLRAGVSLRVPGRT